MYGIILAKTNAVIAGTLTGESQLSETSYAFIFVFLKTID